MTTDFLTTITTLANELTKAGGTPFGLLMHPTTWEAFAARLAIAPDESGMRVNMVNGLRVGTYPFLPLGYVQCLTREEWEALFAPLSLTALGIKNLADFTDPAPRRPLFFRPFPSLANDPE